MEPHVKNTPNAQANREVEHKKKRIRSSQSKGLDWKKELRKYMTVYHDVCPNHNRRNCFLIERYEESCQNTLRLTPIRNYVIVI